MTEIVILSCVIIHRGLKIPFTKEKRTNNREIKRNKNLVTYPLDLYATFLFEKNIPGGITFIFVKLITR